MKRYSKWLMEQVQQVNRQWRCDQLSLVLTDDEGITPLNETYFGKARPTDVISFMYDEIPGEEGEGPTGEVIVNAQRAEEVGPEHQGVNRELALYIAHGCHHLTGATDETPEQRDAMRSKEVAWLDEAERCGHLTGLTEEDPDTTI